jgi:hypothetical protein
MTTSSDNDETKLYSELKGFLASGRADLRKAATEAVLQIHDHDDMAKLVRNGIVELLGKNVSYTDPVISENALKGLLQLSSVEGSPTANATASQCVEVLVESGGLDRMMEILLTNAASTEDDILWRQRVNLAMALVANMTRTEEGSINLCGRQLPDEAVAANSAENVQLPPKPTLELLLARFLNPQYLQETNYRALLNNPSALDNDLGDPFQHFAAVLMNATQTEQGRSFLLKLHYTDKVKSTSVFQRLLPELRSPNPVRRRGVAGIIRNCCLDKDSSFWFTTQIGLIKHILYPLAGPEELDFEDKQGLNPDLWLEGPDKERESDHLTRLFLVQAILMLCEAGRNARNELNKAKTCVILKWADMVEEYEDVTDVISQCFRHLKPDENNTATIEEVNDEEEETQTRKAISAQPVGSAVTQEEFDSVD